MGNTVSRDCLLSSNLTNAWHKNEFL
jgi:hypothetical protein